MKRILFVCHGNICRSPMAEYIMKKLVKDAGMQDVFEIASAATSTEELGNPVYPPAKQKLAEHGIACNGHRARQVTIQDYHYYDIIVAMDSHNIRNMHKMFGGDPQHKINLLLNYTQERRDVADPWYTNNFDATWRDCMNGCSALLKMAMNDI